MAILEPSSDSSSSRKKESLARDNKRQQQDTTAVPNESNSNNSNSTQSLIMSSLAATTAAAAAAAATAPRSRVNTTTTESFSTSNNDALDLLQDSGSSLEEGRLVVPVESTTAQEVQQSKKSKGRFLGFLQRKVSLRRNRGDTSSGSNSINSSSATNEHTPLLHTDTEAQQQQHPLLVETTTTTTTTSSSSSSAAAVKRWDFVRAHKGDFTLMASVSASDPNNNNNSNSNSNNNNTSVEAKRRQAQAEIRSLTEFTLQQCCCAIAAYILIAIFSFSVVFDHWTVIDSAYFAVTTFTTVGTGDVVPDSHAGRIFTCFFALSGVAFLGLALGTLGNNIIDAEHKAMEQAGEMSKVRVVSLFSSSVKKSNATSTVAIALAEDEEEEEGVAVDPLAIESSESSLENENVSPPNQPHQVVQAIQRNPISHILCEFALVVAILMVFAAVVADDPGVDPDWDLGSGLYYAIITSTTVGYGDLAPQSQKGRLFAIFFIPLTVGVMGHWLSIVAKTIIDSRQSNFHRRMEMQELSQHDLDIMDADGDGNVSHAEFLEFMLVAMNKVDKSFIDEMRVHFRRLDTDNTGHLTKIDLIAAAKRKLKSPTRKLQLSNYKQQVLQQAKAARQQSHRRGGSFWGSHDSGLGFGIPAIFATSSSDENIV